MATFLVGVSEARSLSRGSSTHLTAVSGIQAVSLFSRPPASSTSTRKSGSSKSRSRAAPSRVSSSKKRMTTLPIAYLLYYPSRLNTPARSAPPDSPGALNTDGDVLSDSLGLVAAKLAGQVGSQERNGLRVVELALAFRGDVLLLESQAGTVQQGLDGAFRHLERAGDLAVAQVLQLAKCQHEPILLRQPLRDRPHLAAHLVRFLDPDRGAALAG